MKYGSVGHREWAKRRAAEAAADRDLPVKRERTIADRVNDGTCAQPKCDTLVGHVFIDGRPEPLYCSVECALAALEARGGVAYTREAR